MDRIQEILSLLGKLDQEKSELMAEYEHIKRTKYHDVNIQLFCVQCQLIDLRKADEKCSLVYDFLLDERAKLDKQLADLDKQFANS
jgi:DNA-binding transcriptional MerR regulator